jgi:hypothetical protein
VAVVPDATEDADEDAPDALPDDTLNNASDTVAPPNAEVV